MRSIWVVGPGSYGRSDADDAAMDAAVLAQAVGKPVRVQYTREQATGWDPKGPASIHRARAAIDASGNVIAYEFTSKGFSRIDVNTNGGAPWDTLAGQLRDVALKSGDGFGVPAESYEFANKRLAWETIAPLLDRGSPLRSAHLRDPVGPQVHFASESFMDELAAALALDPVEFRLRHVKEPRDIAVIKAAAEKAGWQSRPSPRRDQTGNQGERPRHRLFPAQRHALRHCGRGRHRSRQRQNLGAQVHGCARLRADHQPGRAAAYDRGQHCPGREPHALGGGQVRCEERDQHRLDDAIRSSTSPRRRETIDVVLINHPGDRAERRGRAVDPAGRRRDCQRDLRRNGRAHSAGPVLPGSGEAGAVVAVMPSVLRSARRARLEGRGDARMLSRRIALQCSSA